MDYKAGDNVEFVQGGLLLKGEIISIKKWPFKRYRIVYKRMTISFFESQVKWIKAKNVIGIDKGIDREGEINISPPRPPRQK